MKKIFILLVIFVLSGCAAMNNHHHTNTAYSDEEVSSQKLTVPNREIPAAVIEKLLAPGQSLDDVAFVLTIDKKGEISLIGTRNQNVQSREIPTPQNPIATRGITGLNSISIVRYEKSNCYVLVPGYVSGGQLYQPVVLCF